MELRQLRSFVAVAEELHFRRAAERLFVAQPSVSQQIRALEQTLGVRLFDRNRRGVTLTPAGVALLDDARDILARAGRAADRARAAAGGARERLRLSLTRSMTGGVADEIVETFRERHADVPLDLSVGFTTLNVARVRDGTVDAAFVRPPLLEPDLEQLQLGREELVCVLPSRHRLARKRMISRDDLRGERLVYWPREHAPHAWDEMLGAVFGPAGPPEVHRHEPDVEHIVAAVADGAGVGIVMVGRSRTLRIPGAVYRPFAPPEPTAGIALIWRRGDDLPALRSLIELAAETMARG
jgi:DNA-binding transcriptional LysR family regulator